MKLLRSLIRAAACLGVASTLSLHAADWLTFEPTKSNGKRIVLLSGDEEYRSEESLPMLAGILSQRHGFHCTVLFAIDPANGTVDPNTRTNIPGMDALDKADVCVMALRFRELPDSQMEHFVKYVHRGGPLIALRTSTHPFAYDQNKTSPYAKYDWRNKDWPGGFGQQVLGETWVNHHGAHAKESTHAVIVDSFKSHPLLHGVSDIWGPTDVYGVVHLPADAQVLLRGEVLNGMKPTDPPVEGAKNNPMMPLAWIREVKSESGKTSKIFTTTMGAAVDLENEGLRRLIVNACFWEANLAVPQKTDVAYIGDYKPTFFGFDKFKRGLKPVDFDPRSQLTSKKEGAN